ncbi:MAG TPA: hypothetical protein VG893_04020 [Terracidiphilus sp.]|nr:hypothetical protein [Terracidiphilus sp.]
MLQEEEAVRHQIREKMVAVIESDPNELARSADLGRELNFAEFVPYFARIIRMYADLYPMLDTETLSFAALNQISSMLDNTRSILHEFTKFSPVNSSSNRGPAVVRSEIIQKGYLHYDQAFQTLAPIIAFCATQKIGVGKMKAEGDRILIAMKGDLESLDKIREEAHKTLEVVKDTARQAGVSQHAGIFADEARLHQKAARWWLGWTILLTIITTCAGCYFFLHAIDPSKIYSGSQAVQVAVAKLALLSILFTATVWVGRFYRAHRHNAVVNKHRSNALRTFETFAKATDDESTKNAVLIKATECIFSPQQTGYTSAESETGGVAQVVEIVRGIATKNG